ncbi:hypothetical protein CRM22_005220 [Opisthorchis felineus]|uniref:DUF4201 domain-containing protein n=1 Tax=Opisthorchis felineus TaxID=147828 RepID=A0A4S2LS97_OPIFE|nr:hypothetical protein CRM22_005220 [Opisthorchis felineus]
MPSRRSLHAVLPALPSKWSQTSHGSTNTVTISELLKNKSASTQKLLVENEAYRRFLEQICGNQEAPDQILPRQQETSDVLNQRHNLRFRSSCAIDKYRRLDAHIKCTIINAEREALITEMQEICRQNETVLSAHKAMLEALTLRLEEIRKSTMEFDKMTKQLQISGNTYVNSHVFVRYFDRCLTRRNDLICSLQMKNVLLRASVRRTKREICRTAKEEKPTKVDFSLARKDNTVFSERLEELSSTINRTKGIHSKLHFQYRTVKDNLLRQISENAQLQRKLLQKQVIMASVAEAKNKLTTNFLEEKLRHQHYQSMMNNYAAPSVNDCVQQIRLSQTIDREIKLCEQRERLSQLIYRQKLSVFTKLCDSMPREGVP